jgi:hypothetical protein
MVLVVNGPITDLNLGKASDHTGQSTASMTAIDEI